MQTTQTRSFAQAGSLLEGSYAGRTRKPAQMMLVPMIDIFTVLVTFLLMTAVFSRITILQLDLPSSAASAPATPPAFRLEVIVRREGFELTNGSKIIAAIPKVNGEYDLKALSALALSLKREYPGADDAAVLLEKDIQYDYLIQTMDAIRSTQAAALVESNDTERQDGPQVGVQKNSDSTPAKVALFTHISVGEAP